MKPDRSNGTVPRQQSDMEESEFLGSSILNLLLQEARAVSLWSFSSTLIRLFFALLALLANYRDSKDANKIWLMQKLQPVSDDTHEWFLIASVVAGWILCLLPSKVALQQAPGFSFASPWLLFWVRDKTGVIPNVPTRACEYMLGRLRLVELVIVLPVHLVCIVSTSVVLQRILPEQLASLALGPIEYANDGNPWIVVSCQNPKLGRVQKMLLYSNLNCVCVCNLCE
jgi:hypothetical protein